MKCISGVLRLGFEEIVLGRESTVDAGRVGASVGVLYLP